MFADARTMFENSPAGLRMLAAEVSVTVTREEAHQAVLARYPVYPGQERRVAVELVWCRIDTGKYQGQRAIEVRLDGSRVGELTFLMSQRYAAMVEQVRTQGGRPGCEAYIERDIRGLQISLRLPSEAEVVTPLPVVPPQPHVPKPQRTKSEKRAMWIVAASVVFVVFLLAGIFGGDGDEPTTPLSGDTTRTTTFEPPPTTATTTTTTTPPPTTTTTVPPPQQTQQPAPPPVEAPVQPSGCDPNYTGCVPIDSDVDCAGGSGNGPSYVEGPVEVIGTDIYGLDTDDPDNIGCE